MNLSTIKRILLVTALVVFGVMIAACTPSTPEPTDDGSDAGETDGGDEDDGEAATVIIGVTDSISSLDFADAYALHDWELFRNVNSGLMGFVPGTAEIEPVVAEDFPEISEDGLTYTFTIEEGWAYPDGTELVAGDFARSVNRALTLEGDVASLVASYVESVEAPDDRTVVFTLLEPRGDFTQIVTGAPYLPVPEGAYPEDELNQFPDTVFGVGPWQITEYTVNEQTVLERNPNYKGDFADGAPDRVIIQYFTDATQLGLAVENGDIDIAWRILGPVESARLGEIEGLTQYDAQGGGIRYLVPNQSMEPFNDVRLRQALAYLLDRGEIIDRALQGQAEPLFSPIPDSDLFIGSTESFLDRYGAGADVAAAEELLGDAGYSEEEPLEFDLWYPPERYGAYASQIFQILEEQFEATPLIQVELQTQEWSTYVGAIVSGEYPIGYLGWFFDYPDSSNYVDPFALSSSSSGLGVFYDNPDMDELLLEAAAEGDAEARAELYRQIQELYAEDVVTLPISFEQEYAVYGTDVAELTIGPAFDFNYETIILADGE